MTRSRIKAVLILLVGFVLPLVPSLALAHEPRDVGRYHLIVGWGDEPTYVGQKNAIELRVTNRTTNQGVTGLEDTLKVEVIVGAQRKEFDLEPVSLPAQRGEAEGELDAGHYTADIIPTKEGAYRFRFFGTIEGTQVNETFDSADGKFKSAISADDISFPSASTVEQQANQARTVGIAGIIAGVVGIVLGGIGLLRGGARGV
jgi:hypothetical protein